MERRGEKLSRNDISWSTGLSNPTVSTVLAEFQELSLVEEVGQSTTRGGRPAQLVRFNPRASCVMSVDLSGSRCHALLVDLSGEVLEREDGPERGGMGNGELFDWLQKLHANWSSFTRLGRAAVAIPGVVEHDSGSVHYAPALGWHNYPLAARLEQKLGLQVTLENDVNALALGEMRFGGASGNNVVFLSITSGVGMGLVLNGSIFRGSHYAAGEVGYSRLESTGRQERPTFGEPGPLESQLLSQSGHFLRDGVVQLGTPEAAPAFDRFTRDLGIIVQNALCLINPDRLVIAWPADREQKLLAAFRQDLTTPMPVEIQAARLGRDAAALGVAAIALDGLEAAFCRLQDVAVA